MDDYREAYVGLKDAARALAAAAARFEEVAPKEVGDEVRALCSAVAGVLLDPESWGKSLRPMALACIDVVRRGLPCLVRRERRARAVAQLETEPFDASRFGLEG